MVFFQASGQGPYFGQCAWFAHFHPEKLESAQTRYANELKCIVGVLDRVLNGKEWLVGDKCTYADLAFGTLPSTPILKRGREPMLARGNLKKVISVLMDKEIQSPGKI